jgi:hypothetical protein
VAWIVTGWEVAAIATVVSLVTWLVIYAVERVPPWYALLYPVGAAMVALIMIRSALRGSSRIEWRGRTYRA